jgi:glycosyltransferase involved in cell wall biosynthesis
MTQQPLLSVLIITYNHEAYIEQTLDSVIMQQTKFDFDIVIGDDASSDRTRLICEQYVAKYPHLIRLIPHTANVGVVPNYIRTLEACRGKYIAHLDGDDYWIDAEKLQKQVDRLDTEPNLTMCYTSRRVFREDWNGFYAITDGEDNKKYYVEDFAGNAFFHLSTIVFRKPPNQTIVNHLSRFKNIVDRPLRMNNNSLFTPTDEIKRSLMTNAMYAELTHLYPHLAKYFNQHLNVSAYFALRDAYRKHDKTTVRQLAAQIIRRPTFIGQWKLKLKAALHIPVSLVG